jgi:hypothetical protein
MIVSSLSWGNLCRLLRGLFLHFREPTPPVLANTGSQKGCDDAVMEITDSSDLSINATESVARTETRVTTTDQAARKAFRRTGRWFRQVSK